MRYIVKPSSINHTESLTDAERIASEECLKQGKDYSVFVELSRYEMGILRKLPVKRAMVVVYGDMAENEKILKKDTETRKTR